MIRVHNNCGYPVSYALVSPGYACCCIKCDEDLYLFETEMIALPMANVLSRFGSRIESEVSACVACAETVLSWQLDDHNRLCDTPEKQP